MSYYHRDRRYERRPSGNSNAHPNTHPNTHPSASAPGPTPTGPGSRYNSAPDNHAGYRQPYGYERGNGAAPYREREGGYRDSRDSRDNREGRPGSRYRRDSERYTRENERYGRDGGRGYGGQPYRPRHPSGSAAHGHPHAQSNQGGDARLAAEIESNLRRPSSAHAHAHAQPARHTPSPVPSPGHPAQPDVSQPIAQLTGQLQSGDAAEALSTLEAGAALDRALEAAALRAVARDAEYALLAGQVPVDALHVQCAQENLDALLLTM